jgi:NitT/TauT family transport system substrate-binding protein
MKNRFRRLAVALLCLFAIVAVSCGDDDTESSRGTDGTRSIRALHSRNAEQLPIFVAQDAGLFANHGLDVTLEEAAGAGQITPAIAGGTGDLGLSTATDLLFAVEEDLDLVFAAGTSVNTPENPRLWLYGAQGAGIVDREDLAGKRVAVPSRGSFAEIGPTILLSRADVDIDSISWVEMPFQEMNEALNQGVVDAAVAVPPFANLMERTGHAQVLDMSELGNSVIIAVLSARRDWAEDNADAVREFRVALEEAINLIETDPAMAKQVTAKYTGLPPAIVEQIPFGNYRAEVTVREVQLWIDLLEEAEALESDVDAKSLIVPAPAK